MDFITAIWQQLVINGDYTVIKRTKSDVIMLTPDDKKVWICYLDSPLEPEQIRRCFDFPGYVLFVVKESLIPQEIESRKATPQWLRVLHGLYMGRIYVWNDKYLFGLHFDYDSGDISESGIIQPDELLLVETGTWLRGWTGVYRLARFYDRAWWTEGAGNYDQQYQWGKQTPPRHEYTYNHDGGKQQHNRQERAYYAPPKQAAPKEDFMRQFAQAGSPSAIKALYRTLAKKFHPDLNPDVDTTETMKAVNAAYERYS